mgnify:CR=1 FL=1
MPNSAVPQIIHDKLDESEVYTTPIAAPSILDENDELNQKNILSKKNKVLLKPLPPLSSLLELNENGEEKVQDLTEEIKKAIFDEKANAMGRIQCYIALQRDEFEEYLRNRIKESIDVEKGEKQVLKSPETTPQSMELPISPSAHIVPNHSIGKFMYKTPLSSQSLAPITPIIKTAKSNNEAQDNSPSEAGFEDKDPEIGFEDVIGATGDYFKPVGPDSESDTDEPVQNLAEQDVGAYEESMRTDYPAIKISGLSVDDSADFSKKLSASFNRTLDQQSNLSLSLGRPVDIRPNPSRIEGDGGRPARTESERREELGSMLSYSDIKMLSQTDPGRMSFSQRMEWEQLGKHNLISPSAYD